MTAIRKFTHTYYGEIHEIHMELSIAHVDNKKSVKIDAKLMLDRERLDEHFSIEYFSSGRTKTSYFKEKVQFENIEDDSAPLSHEPDFLSHLKMSKIFAEQVQDMLYIKGDYIFDEAQFGYDEEEFLDQVLLDFFHV